jgi:intein/homing endonuclease
LGLIDVYDNIDVVMEQGASMIEYYRNDPVMAAYDLLNVDLAPIQRVILRDMWFKNFTITVAGRGCGKCQSTDSMSFVDGEGLVYLYEKFDNVPAFLRSGDSLDVRSNDYIYTSEGYVSTKRTSFEKDVEGISLTTKAGFENKGSKHHPILTINEDGDFYYKQLKDFEVGDYVCIQRGQNTFGECEVPPDDAYLIGLFIGDGMIADTYNHQDITTSDEYIINYCTDYCDRYNIHYRIDEDKRTDSTVKIIFKQFDWFFDKYNIKRCLSYDKEVPYSIRTSNENTQIEFLRGLFDTDGGFEKNGVVTLCSVSEKLIKETQMMLLNFGIVSTIRNKKTKSKFGKAFILSISGDDIKLFSEFIGFNLWRKQNLLESYIESNKFNTNKNIIPFIKNTIVRDLAKKYGSFESFSKLFSNTRYRFDDGNRKNLSYDILNKIVNTVELYNVDNDIYNKLLRIRNRNYYFDTVKSVDDWSGDCYDFEMDMTGDVEPNYFCNGFINHNTFLLGVNAVLHALLYPGYRVGLMGPGFRQSKFIFNEVEKIYQRSPIVREACVKKPTRGADTYSLEFRGTDRSNGSYIAALPVGVDGSKIRGSRFYLIEIDELAQMQPEIIDMVIRPMAAVSSEPMQRVRERERQKELIRQGMATEEDFVDESANKMVMASSGYFKFNHMWDRMRAYWKAMRTTEGEKKYAVHQVPYQLMPEAFLDMENINSSKIQMSTIEFMMEYEAAMVSDSDGFFKASMLDACTLGSDFSLQLVGSSGKEYVMGVDPSQGGAAACGVVILEVGSPHKLVYVNEIKGKTTQKTTIALQELCENFNIVKIFMDSQGGGKAIRDLLQEGYGGKTPILDIDDELTKGHSGKRILKLVNPTVQWINEANFDTLALIEHKDLRFPVMPREDKPDPIAEKLYEEVKVLKSQMLNIVVTQTARGSRHFDTPTKGQNKDLYSAIVLAGWGVREMGRQAMEKTQTLCTQGLIRPREGGQFVRASAGTSQSWMKDAIPKPRIK